MKYLAIGFLFLVNVASAKSVLDEHRWLMMDCHNEKSSFQFSISSDSLGGINQITDATIGGEIKKAMEWDPIEEKPIVALAKRNGNNFEILLRYENNIMWPTYLNLKMTYKPDGYITYVNVTGDEGEYLKEKTVFQCSIGNHGRVYLQTSKF
nr:hypothetical protein BHI3_31030 [Bacteriovorax sp. HI3]